MVVGIGIVMEDRRLQIAAVEERSGEIFQESLIFVPRNEKATEKTLNELWEKNHWDRHNVVLSIPARDCILRKFNVPFTDVGQIDQIIYYETERYIPSRAIEDLAVDYQILEQRENEMRLLVAAVSRKAVQGTLDVVESAGIYPFAIVPDAMGLVYAAERMGPMQGCRSFMLLDIHPDGFTMALWKGGKLWDLRSTRLSARSVLDNMTGDINETTELRLENDAHPSISADDTAQEIFSDAQIERFCRRLSREMSRVFLETDAIDKICLSGPLNFTERVSQRLRKEIDVPISLFSLSQASHPQKIDGNLQNGGTAAIGLAIGACGPSSKGMNFRKEEFRYKQAFEIMKIPLAALVTLIFIALLVASFYLQGICSRLGQKYDKLTTIAETVHRRMDVPEVKDVSRWNKIYEIRQSLEQLLNSESSGIPPIQDALPIWASLSCELSKVRRKYLFTVDEVHISQSQIVFSGRMESDLCLDLMKQHIRETSWVEPKADAVRVISTENIHDLPKHDPLRRRYKYEIQLSSNDPAERR